VPRRAMDAPNVVCGGWGAEKVKRGGAERGPRAQVLGSRCNFGARQPDDAKRAAVRRLLVAAGAHEGWGENWEWVAVRCPRPLRWNHWSLGAIGCSASPWRLEHCRPALPWSRVSSLARSQHRLAASSASSAPRGSLKRPAPRRGGRRSASSAVCSSASAITSRGCPRISCRRTWTTALCAGLKSPGAASRSWSARRTTSPRGTRARRRWASRRAPRRPPLPPSRTNWIHLVPPPVLTGHVSSLPPCCRPALPARAAHAAPTRARTRHREMDRWRCWRRLAPRGGEGPERAE